MDRNQGLTVGADGHGFHESERHDIVLRGDVPLRSHAMEYEGVLSDLSKLAAIEFGYAYSMH